jgi:uncharacterized membrane protein YdjX (TVP38/TMEM64 family)
MRDAILHFFQAYPQIAVLSAFVFSVAIAFIGLIPSFVITAANIHFFGFWEGITITFFGEAIGVWLAFLLYRKGFKKGVQHRMEKHPRAKALLEAAPKDAFWLIFSLRLVPIVPAGLVTFTAAMGRISALGFVVAGSLGKLPSLFLEGFAVMKVMHIHWKVRVLILALLAALLIFFVVRHIVRAKKQT